MTRYKTLLSSSTIKACIVGIFAVLAGMGYDMFTPEKATQIADSVTATQPSIVTDQEWWVEMFSRCVALISFVVAFFGRKNATAQIVSKHQLKMLTRVTGLVLLVGLTVSSIGCQYSKAEHVIFREGIWSGLSTTAKEHNEWAGFIAGDTDGNGTIDGPPRFDLLPDLTIFTEQQRTTWLQARRYPYNEAKLLVEEDRKRVN